MVKLTVLYGHPEDPASFEMDAADIWLSRHGRGVKAG